ncbi:helix-turn-helix domain-containing protein [Enorma phocaeensis]|uniref:helix-turn-helix domain-containing protein n=1 Tax=Enorma phocaeensis TaxID=1871019 RepID=UPI001C643A32|nr:helix-turn-helix transcriptional regulator [Enorma phocaeensis]
MEEFCRKKQIIFFDFLRVVSREHVVPIVMRLDRVMADRKISSVELAELVGISPVNISRIKTGKLKGIRFSTLEGLCKALRCKPGDIIDWLDDEEYKTWLSSLPSLPDD